MSTLDEDLARLNFEYLILVRDCARSNPMEASWRFGIAQDSITDFADLSLEQIREKAAINKAVINFLPFGKHKVSDASYTALLALDQQTQEGMHE